MPKLWASSIVNKSGEPIVNLSKDEEVIAQMTPEQARSHAMDMLEAAEAAEQDAFMVDYTRNVIKANESAVAGIIVDFRRYREAYAHKKVIEGQNRKNA